MNAYALTWTGVLDWIKQHAPGNSFKMFPHQIQHPKDAGMTMALDVPLGQRTTYRMLVADNMDLVVRDFGAYYEAFLELRPTMSGLEKTLTESPGTSVAGMVAAGALLGLLFGRSKNSALTGAAIGALAGLAGVGVANARTSPQTSKMAVDLLKLMKEMPIPIHEPKQAAKRPARKAIEKAVKVEILPREPRKTVSKRTRKP